MRLFKFSLGWFRFNFKETISKLFYWSGYEKSKAK